MKLKTRTATLKSLCVPVLLACVMALLPAWTSRGQAAKPDNPLLSAWQQAKASGSYRFAADIVQTLIPKPLPGMIGSAISISTSGLRAMWSCPITAA